MKIIMRLLLGLVLAGGVALVVVKQKAIAMARFDQHTLAAESKEARQLAEQNKDMERLRAETGELEKLRQENRDLPKLRNEVRQLRRQADELAKLRAENLRLSAAAKNGSRPGSGIQLPPGYITRASLVDAGLQTPEAAVQTAFWALTQGNFKRVIESVTPEMAKKMMEEGGEEKFRRESENTAKIFPGFRIKDKTVISPDEVVIQIEIVEGENDGHGFHLKRIGNEWRLNEGGMD